jgi:hypothetical protein
MSVFQGLVEISVSYQAQSRKDLLLEVISTFLVSLARLSKGIEKSHYESACSVEVAQNAIMSIAKYPSHPTVIRGPAKNQGKALVKLFCDSAHIHHWRSHGREKPAYIQRWTRRWLSPDNTHNLLSLTRPTVRYIPVSVESG